MTRTKRIRQIAKENLKVIRLGRARHRLVLVIDGYEIDLHVRHWKATRSAERMKKAKLEVAEFLNRFKFGD